MFLVLQAISVFSQNPKLWGIDQWHYFSGATAVILFAAGVLPVFPAFRAAVVRLVDGAGSTEIANRIKIHTTTFNLLLLAAAAVLFWIFRQATHFLGDGYLWINHVEMGNLYRYWELITSCWLYRRISVFINFIWPLSTVNTQSVSVIISMVSGLVFLFFAYKTAHALSEKTWERRFLLLAVLSTGTVILFFGYVEAYPPAAAGVMAYLYYGLQCVRRRKGVKVVTLVFLLAILLHPSLAALLPSLLLLFWMRSGRALGRRKYYITLSVLVAAGFVFLWIAQKTRLFSGYFHESFLPFITSSQRNRVPYHLFSPGNVFDLLNELLLICPICIFAVAAFMRSAKKKDKFKGGILQFLGTVVIFYVLEFFVANKLIGASRDWDIFSPMALPLALFTSIILLERFRDRRGDLAVIAFFILALHTVPWIGINASWEMSLNRFADLVKNESWSGYARGYAFDELGTYYMDEGNVSRALEYSVAATETDPGNVRYLYNAATIFMKDNKYPEAVQFYEKAIHKKPDYLQARSNLGTLYLDMGDLKAAEREFREVIRIDSTFVPGYSKLASVYKRQSRYGVAEALYIKSIKMATDDPANYVNLAVMYMETGETEKAKSSLERSMEVDEEFAVSHRLLGKIYLGEGDLRRAAEQYDKYIELEPRDLEARFDLAVTLDGLKRLDEALYHLLYILERKGNDIRVMNNIGVIYSRQGKFEEAVRIFKRALRWDPEQPVIHVNLARAYYRLGEYEFSWNHVIETERLNAVVPASLLSNLSKAMKRPGR